ncbi:hypothetical protein KL86APRO_12462 [uncultured Alphaproteobacteria bacterium]|uniref:Uncharacterized protein n=1 Tax=uncultured Alphaproteobacteria bacterium TaxID=91750 RepID=A0A212KAW9_9PROT|nr:hypothetical protein KL86APRO_12462 [uncultured Alphaproteobacteria bacterium]
MLHAAHRRRRRAHRRGHPQASPRRSGQGVDQHRGGAPPRVRARGGGEVRQPVHRRRHRREAGRPRQVRDLHPRRPQPHRHRRGGVGAADDRLRRGRNPADVDGSRRHPQRFRPRAHPRGGRRGAGAGDRLGWRRHPRPPRRRHPRGRRDGGAGGVDLPLRRIFDRRGQGSPRRGRDSGAPLRPSTAEGDAVATHPKWPRLFVKLFGIGAALVLVVSLGVYEVRRKAELAALEDEKVSTLAAQSAFLLDVLGRLSADLTILGRQSELEDPDPEALERLAKEYGAFVRAVGDYQSVRLLDSHDTELVRAGTDEFGVIHTHVGAAPTPESDARAARALARRCRARRCCWSTGPTPRGCTCGRCGGWRSRPRTTGRDRASSSPTIAPTSCSTGWRAWRTTLRARSCWSAAAVSGAPKPAGLCRGSGNIKTSPPIPRLRCGRTPKPGAGFSARPAAWRRSAADSWSSARYFRRSRGSGG